MSDNWLRYVPSDPRFQPTPSAVEQAKVLLMSYLPQSEEVTAEFFESPQFIDPGSNWSGVSCSSCGANAEPWWDEAVSRAADQGFSSLEVHAPCCGAKVSLNELRYEWPAAFGSFVLEAMNPNRKGLSDEQLEQLGRVLGGAVREVAQHL